MERRLEDNGLEDREGGVVAATTLPRSKFVAYERVSTARQGTSGLGLEAQRKSIEDFARSHNTTLLGRYTEVESGKTRIGPNWPKR